MGGDNRGAVLGESWLGGDKAVFYLDTLVFTAACGEDLTIKEEEGGTVVATVISF